MGWFDDTGTNTLNTFMLVDVGRVSYCNCLVLLLAGHPVCREAFAHLLGVGKHRLTRCRKSFQGRDMRSIGGRGGTFENNYIF